MSVKRRPDTGRARHRDPHITFEVYGHLTPACLRKEVDSLSLGLTAPAAALTDHRAGDAALSQG